MNIIKYINITLLDNSSKLIKCHAKRESTLLIMFLCLEFTLFK
jgi:hypothetical protein